MNADSLFGLMVTTACLAGALGAVVGWVAGRLFSAARGDGL